MMLSIRDEIRNHKTVFIAALLSAAAITAILGVDFKPTAYNFHLEDPEEFKAAKAAVFDFQKKKKALNINEVSQIMLEYLLYTEAGNITAQLGFTFSLEADSLKEGLFHASFNLSSVDGKNTFDKFLISMGRIFGKVPDTNRQIKIDLILGEHGLFKTLRYWEVPHPKFRIQWAKILAKRKKLLKYKHEKKSQEKIKKLETKIQNEMSALWSPFIVEFIDSPEKIIRYKKNNLDIEMSWENESLIYSNQTGLFTAFFNLFLISQEKEKVFPVVFVFKDSKDSPEGKKMPKFVMEELQLSTVFLDEKEADEYYPCNMKLEIKGDKNLPLIFNNPIYLRIEPVGSSIPSYIYIGDIMDSTKEKKVLGKMRAYLKNTALLSHKEHQAESNTSNIH